MSPSAATREAQEQEQALSSSLAAANEQLKAQSDTFLERSKLRSGLGDHAGALKDAQCAVTLSPESAECLVRLSQALIRCGQPSQAFDAYKQASSIVDAKEEKLSADLVILRRQLLPFDELPTEILVTIFLVLYADWQNLPSPFQIPHVCQRWRRIANSTPALWRDTRILRVSGKTTTYISCYFPCIKRPFCLSRDTDFPDRHICGRQDGNHFDLVSLCSELSKSTLTHFEMEVWEWNERFEILEWVMLKGQSSRPTLESIALRHTNSSQRQRYPRRNTRRVSSHFATLCLQEVLLCPKLVHVELSVGELLSGDDHPLSAAALDAAPTPSFRRLELDCFGGFTGATGDQGRQLLLQRSTQLTSLALRNVPSVDWNSFASNGQPFAIQLLEACAGTLTELEVQGRANVLAGVVRAGATSFPHLRRLRYLASKVSDQDEQDIVQQLVLPVLKAVEAPVDIVRGLPSIPSDITLRLDDRRSDSDCQIRDWLLSLNNDQSPHSLTILATWERASLQGIFDALTPSIAGKVICPKLQSLAIRCTTVCYPDTSGNLLTLDPLPLPRPVWREEWEGRPDASPLARLEEERRRASQGHQPPRRSPSSTTPFESPSKKAPSLSGDIATVWASCEPLSSIQIEGCFVSKQAWAKMMESTCRFSATPSPDDFAKLRWENTMNAKRKRED